MNDNYVRLWRIDMRECGKVKQMRMEKKAREFSEQLYQAKFKSLCEAVFAGYTIEVLKDGRIMAYYIISDDKQISFIIDFKNNAEHWRKLVEWLCSTCVDVSNERKQSRVSHILSKIDRAPYAYIIRNLSNGGDFNKIITLALELNDDQTRGNTN